MPRRGRVATRSSRRISTPVLPQDDESMVDAPEDSQLQSQDETEPTDAIEPAQDSDQNQDEEDPDVDADIDPVSDASLPRASFYRDTEPRRRRPGRPPRNQPLENERLSTPGGEDASDAGTPRIPKKRGRPFSVNRGGFRGRPRQPRGGPAQATRVAVDKEGNMMDVVGDEVQLPEDPEGETKVDKMGNLLGGRDYRVRVFTLAGRGDRLYMLSTEPARCTGFRDSYLFFTKHMHLFKIIIGDDEKRDLIDRDLIPHSYKGRAIGVVTARSVFREFGARIVIGGRKVTDDYFAQAARDRGDVEGEIADPQDRLPPAGEQYNKNQYVAWHGASSVYHTNTPSVPMPNGRPGLPGKRKPNITSGNWQFEHAREASRFNSGLAALRRHNLNGVYDPHTNVVLYPAIMQPTHAKWEIVPPTPSSPTHKSTIITRDNEASQKIPINENDTSEPSSVSSRFNPTSTVISRNFLVVDTHYTSPPHPSFPVPGPPLPMTGTYPPLESLTPEPGLPDLSSEDLLDLPVDAREAFVTAKAAERQWRTQWGIEAHDGARGKLKIGVGL